MPFLAETLYQNLVRRVWPDAPLSVHLTSYPDRDENSIDSALLTAMDTAQRIVALGRAARERAGVKVRQPLAAMYVRAPNAEAETAIGQLQEIILGEINVKSLCFARSEDEFVAHDVRPNLPVLGPRYGRRLPRIRRALESLDPSAVARAVERGRSVQVAVDGATLELMPHEILTEAREKEGYAAMAGEGYLVVLDTRLDRELIREGLAREVVRRVNDWRRAAGFEIDNRIAVRYDASSELAAAIEDHRKYICQETLATSLAAGPPVGLGFQAQAEFDREWLSVELTREPLPL